MHAAYITAALFFAHQSPAIDCGASRYGEVIKKTTSLILEKAAIGSLVREFPTFNGTPECTRVKFSIDSDGRAINISMPESSGNFDVDMAVVRSVKKYHFRTETFGAFRTYMLVFKVDYNKIPSNYFNK